MSVSLLTTPRAWVDRHVRSRLPGAAPRNPLAGKRILVTGASSGIGAATARACAARGATVLLVARRAEGLGQVLREIEERGGTATAYPCDLTDGPAVDDLVARVLDEHGGVDLLVNNAGRSIRRSIALSYDRMHDFERTMAINYFAPVRLMLGLLPGMVERGLRRDVRRELGCLHLHAPGEDVDHVAAPALDVFSRIAGRELYGDGVTFTNIRLSLVRTAMIGPTDAYRRAPALSPEQAAEKVVRALEDRPITVNVVAGNVAEVFNLVAPRLSDVFFHRLSRRFPDSRAAARHIEEPAEDSAAS